MTRVEAYRDLPTQRQCGACDLCCTTVGVNEIGKPPETRCAHLCGTAGKSCGIYANRPDDCAEYVCLWRGSDGLLPASMYPADCGFVLSLSGVGFPRLITLTWDPDRPDAWDTDANRTHFAAIVRYLNACVVIGERDHAKLVITPVGVTFARADNPELFTATSVGVPEDCFLPERMSAPEFAMRLFAGKVEA